MDGRFGGQFGHQFGHSFGDQFSGVDSQLNGLRERQSRASSALVDEFERRLEISWIYHDSALEGVVLSYSEIKAAIDKKIISDVSLIPSYEELKAFNAAIEYVRELAGSAPGAPTAQASAQAARKKPINLETVRKLYSLLAPDEVAKGIPYRKDNPLHRLYYHEISQPDKIAARMKKFGEWFEEEPTKRMHPVERAARAHFKLMSIYPWTHNTGRVARLLSNVMLMREGYPLAIVHSIDRQRYYEVLRVEHAGIVPLYVEAVATSIETAVKFFEEARAVRQRRAS